MGFTQEDLLTAIVVAYLAGRVAGVTDGREEASEEELERIGEWVLSKTCLVQRWELNLN